MARNNGKKANAKKDDFAEIEQKCMEENKPREVIYEAHMQIPLSSFFEWGKIKYDVMMDEARNCWVLSMENQANKDKLLLTADHLILEPDDKSLPIQYLLLGITIEAQKLLQRMFDDMSDEVWGAFAKDCLLEKVWYKDLSPSFARLRDPKDDLRTLSPDINLNIISIRQLCFIHREDGGMIMKGAADIGDKYRCFTNFMPNIKLSARRAKMFLQSYQFRCRTEYMRMGAERTLFSLFREKQRKAFRTIVHKNTKSSNAKIVKTIEKKK